MMRERRKQLAHLLRRGVGGDVEVLGRQCRQQVAHGAADDEGLEALFLQGFDVPVKRPFSCAGMVAIRCGMPSSRRSGR
jgi:hypothetical protein